MISVINGIVAVIQTTFPIDLTHLNVKKYKHINVKITQYNTGIDRLHFSLTPPVNPKISL
jgi:hypothetical protein